LPIKLVSHFVGKLILPGQRDSVVVNALLDLGCKVLLKVDNNGIGLFFQMPLFQN
jgi:hypothetical protein